MKSNIYAAKKIFKTWFWFVCISFLILVPSITAADLSETQLIAVKSNAVLPTCDPRYCTPQEISEYLLGLGYAHTNVLIATGASMGFVDSNGNNRYDPGENFDPFLITFFGRATAARPVPNIRNQPFLDFYIGVNNTVKMSGQASLYDFISGQHLLSAPSYTDERDDWVLSRGQFRRPTYFTEFTRLYLVRHHIRLELSSDWKWLFVPASCSGFGTNVAVCEEQSIPFYIGLNPGEPQP